MQQSVTKINLGNKDTNGATAPTTSKAAAPAAAAAAATATAATTAGATQPQAHPFKEGDAGNGHIKRYCSFDDMPISMQLLRGIYSHGFESPSDIQQLSTVPIARGDDVIAQASAGGGKTGAFVVGMLARIDFERLAATPAAAPFVPQVLALSPTRELAKQTHDVSLGIGQYLWPDHMTNPVALLTAGSRVQDDIKALTAPSRGGGGCAAAAGTPGRVLQLLEKGVLRPDQLKVLVLDEADELLSQGFAEQIAKTLRFMPRDIQIVLVSATFVDEVRELADKIMRPERSTRILLEPEQVPVQSIRQYYVQLRAQDEKMLCLTDLYEQISVAQSIIFVNSRRKAEYVASELNRQGFVVSLTHGELDRAERDAVMTQFRGGHSRVLVTTDLVSRGIDVYHCNIVINYDLPVVLEKYIHRIGRCGRFGRKGAAINLLAPEDVPVMRQIEDTFGVRPRELPMDFQAMFG